MQKSKIKIIGFAALSMLLALTDVLAKSAVSIASSTTLLSIRICKQKESI